MREDVLAAIILSKPLTVEWSGLGSFLEKSSERVAVLSLSSADSSNGSSIAALLLFPVLSLFKSTYSKLKLIGVKFSIDSVSDDLASDSRTFV